MDPCLSVEMPQDAHFLIVPLGLTAMECVPFSSALSFKHQEERSPRGRRGVADF